MVPRCDAVHAGRVAVCLFLVLSLCALARATPYQPVAKWGSEGSAHGQFQHPRGVAVDASGKVYVADTYNHRVQRFTSGGVFLGAWGTEGSGDGEFLYPFGVAVGGSGSVYVADRDNCRIQKFSSGGAFVTKWGSWGAADGELKSPADVAVDGAGNVYVADDGNERIQKFSSSGAYITKWGSYGTGNGQLRSPLGVAVDGSGKVYVADTFNDRIQKFTSTGTFLTNWGSTGSGDGQFSRPLGVDVDSSGEVYVPDLYNSRVQKFTSSGGFITKWGSGGVGDGEFNGVADVATDSSGSVYVLDRDNHRVQKFEPDITTLEWAGTQGYASDGVKPNSGPPGTTFTFKVKYTAPGGAEPLKATCRIYKLSKAHVWQFSRKIDLAHTSGSIAAGAIYEGTAELPYGRWKYRFHFRAADGTYLVDDPPAKYQRGPVSTRTEPATLSWAGTSGYTSDGVGPNRGTSGGTFTFKVKYTDPMRLDPVLRICTVERCIAGSWRPYASYTMEKESGSPATGAIYSRAVKLPNYTWRYTFTFKADGADAPIDADPPALWQQGPLLKGPPRLYWAGEAGYASDGVRPNSGPVGTRFTFKVMCQTSDIYGPMPGAHDLVLRRNGNPYKTKEMVEGSGKNRTGRAFSASVTLTRPGDYTYRFRFANVYGPAKGDPAAWRAGPEITTVSSLSLSGLSAAPTNAGAQLTFTLSSSASVTATVLNVAGRPIRTVAIDKPLDAGLQTLLWDRKDATGLSVPAGLYLIRLTARADDGAQSNAVTPLSVP